MADGSQGRSKQLSHLFPSALWLLTFVAALKTVPSWLNKGVFLTLPFQGNASLPWYCLKMLRGISVPSKLKLKIKIDQVRSSASVDCLDLSGFTARTLLFTLSLRWSFEVTSQFWDSCVWFWLLRLGCPLPSFGKLKKILHLVLTTHAQWLRALRRSQLWSSKLAFCSYVFFSGQIQNCSHEHYEVQE